MNEDIRRGRMLVHRIANTEREVSPVQWDLADLTDENVAKHGAIGRSRNTGTESLTIAQWAEEIGWEETGYEVGTLKKMVTEARAWPSNRRVEAASFWAHYEARSYHKGDLTAARKMLVARTKGAATEIMRPRAQRSKSVIKIINDIQGWVEELADLAANGSFVADEFDTTTLTEIATRLMDVKEMLESRREEEMANV